MDLSGAKLGAWCHIHCRSRRMTRLQRAFFLLAIAISACDVFGPERRRIATLEIQATDDTLGLRTLNTTLTAIAHDAQH